MNKRLFNQQNLTRRLRLLSVMCAMLLMPFSAWADSYFGINIDTSDEGIWVTDANASNILGDGTMSYDVTNNILTLNGIDLSFTSDVSYDAFIAMVDTDHPTLTVRLVGDNILTLGEKACVFNGWGITFTTDTSNPGTLTINTGDNWGGALFIDNPSHDPITPTYNSGLSLTQNGNTYTIQVSSTTSYDITVAGIPVTSQNASNITGDNIEAYTAGEPYSVSYDAASNTLSLTNARIASGGIASTSDAALNVALNNSVVLGGTGVNAISCAGDLSISAVGTGIVLYPVVSTKDGGATLTLRNGSNADAQLTLNYQGSECGFATVVYDGLYLSAENPRDLRFSPSRKRFEESADAWASQIIFSSAKTYELWLGGTKVTESNKDNILSDWGSATFDPDENLLTLNGMTLTGTGIYTDGIISRLPNLTISVNGDNTITCSAETLTHLLPQACLGTTVLPISMMKRLLALAPATGS